MNSHNYELDENLIPEKLNRTIDLPIISNSQKDLIQLIGVEANKHSKLMGMWMPLVWQENIGVYTNKNMSILCLEHNSCYPLASMNVTTGKQCIYKRFFIHYADFYQDICGAGYSMPGKCCIYRNKYVSLIRYLFTMIQSRSVIWRSSRLENIGDDKRHIPGENIVFVTSLAVIADVGDILLWKWWQEIFQDWTAIESEYGFDWRVGNPMFILNAISSKNTHHNFETFDGVKLKYTNWRFEPIARDGIVFAYENDEPFFMGKFLK